MLTKWDLMKKITYFLLFFHVSLLCGFLTFRENEKSKAIYKRTAIKERENNFSFLSNLQLKDFLTLNDTLQLCLVVNHEGENLSLDERRKIAEVVINRRKLNYNNNGITLSSQILAPKQFSYFLKKNNFLSSMANFNPQNNRHIETYNLCCSLLNGENKILLPLSVIGFCHKKLYKKGKGKLYCSLSEESHCFYYSK